MRRRDGRSTTCSAASRSTSSCTRPSTGSRGGDTRCEAFPPNGARSTAGELLLDRLAEDRRELVADVELPLGVDEAAEREQLGVGRCDTVRTCRVDVGRAVDVELAVGATA